MSRILHLAYDEKFIDFAVDSFNACAGIVNEFRIMSPDNSRAMRYIKSLGADHLVDASYLESREMLSELERADGLVVHYLGIPAAKLILRAPRDLPIGWRGWGGDYYDLLPDSERQQLLGPATRAIVDEIRGDGSLHGMVRDQMRRLRRRWYTRPLIHRAVARVGVFSAPVRADVATVERAFGRSFRAQYAQLNYKSVERSFAVADVVADRTAILVGNSSTETNNHADVFRLLARLDLHGRSVVVPLTYGDELYRNAVLALGRQQFGVRFEPLTDFIPQSSYNALVSRCGIVIMGHRRQQGLGNVGTLLYGGARIFFDSANPIYHELVGHGAVVGTLDDIERLGERAFAPLSVEEHRINKGVTEKLWSATLVAANTRAFVQQLLESRRGQGG
jgi:dTDP-N-acetylfucosamine:lipid II N-acetylfucosaminyltransferase